VTIKILSLVEATTINAVAKNVLEFHRAARELQEQSRDFPNIGACVVTFERNRDSDESPNEFISAARQLDLEVVVIPERRRFDLSTLPTLRKVVEQQKPDIVVTHSVKSHFLLWRSRVWREFPWVAFHHGYTTTDLKMRAYNRLDRWSLPVADRLVTVCEAFARELARTTGVAFEKISVQHNSVRPRPAVAAEDVQALRTRLGIANGERVVLTVGRLSREKAHLDLLAAYKLLHDMNPAILSKLIIVGDGPERARLEAAVDAHGLRERVIFTGQVSDVQVFYAAADVFVLPSHSEGSPNVLLEAMAASLPIVATAVGGVTEVVKHDESALLVPAQDPRALAAAAARVLTEQDLAARLTTKSTALIADRFTPQKYVRALVEIYREVIEARAQANAGANPLLIS
jgi:glycosyltransferase involved in cell wall biosynthesis